MKLQCSCGAKYAFEATADMVNQPVKFICPSCGLDSSEFVNQLIRQEFGAQAAAAPAPVPPGGAPLPATAGATRLKISHDAPAGAVAAPAPGEAEPVTLCPKHREPATEHCAVCRKPICRKCLELFGYFCSPHCKNKAEEQHLNVPVYAGRGDLVEAQFWRKTGLIAGSIGTLVVLLVGIWIWWAWFGSVPHPYFSVRFEDTDRGYYGASQLVSPDQIIFLHGGTLARYDLKTKKQIWSDEVITKEQIDAAVKAANDMADRIDANSDVGYHHRPSSGDIERSVKQALQSQLSLYVDGHNIWVDRTGTLTRYDWDTGKAVRTVALPEREGALVRSGDELQIVGGVSVTHVDLATGDTRVEEYSRDGAKTVQLAQNNVGVGMPDAYGNNQGPMDPKKVEAQAQNMKLQGRLALPALLSNARHEQQIENALNDNGRPARVKSEQDSEDNVELTRLVAGGNGVARISWRMLEKNIVTRSAMKGPPAKSALNGDLNASKTTDVANEILNNMQRNAGGGTVTEDDSRYQVTVHLPGVDGATDWTGELVGPPNLFVLKTVNVIAAGKNIVVLDKNNKKVWSAALTYPVSAGDEESDAGETSPYGEGPCVEHGNTLYIFDQAVLTAFDLASGNARWRLPSVGVVGLFFDDKNDVYVNTTTGNPDDIRYSKQIDISRRTEAVVSKIDAKTGKTLWTVKPGGFVSYLSGKFIYVMDSYDPNPTDADVNNDMVASLQKPPYMRLLRLNPSDGRTMWESDQDRCPVNWRFEKNSIELIFKREVQVLHYLTF